MNELLLQRRKLLFYLGLGISGVGLSWLTGLTIFLRSAAVVVLLGLGLLAIFPTWSYRLLSNLPIGKLAREPTRKGLVGEFWLGTQLGLLRVLFAGPVLGGILVLAAVNHQIIGAFGLLVVFGVGAAVPMLMIAYGGRRLTQRLLKLYAHSAAIQRAGGVIIVTTVIAILQGWDIQIQLWLAPFFPSLPL
jgi:cytochrome c-type biogenesis protein